ncbi:Ephrin type-A receptor 5 [Desmophyllum pertusum]|uniref:Ephrin type-A receptor 5 n=1 Tax=Desmophyllum pertusum TaxID=174260 RepID=A0A9X0CY23_9CNID|nr:Ephrin type-A receptor 5 [Desmophyllum pertusum]
MGFVNIQLQLQSDHFIKDKALYPNPLQNTAAYENVTRIGRLINERTFETISIINKGKYLLLAFHNDGSCNVLYSVIVRYYVCPAEPLDNSLVSLARTVAPVNDSQPVRVEGSCEKDTVACRGHNGEWNTSGLKGKCICIEDMQNVGGTCQACPDGKYNDQNGLNCTVLPSAPMNVDVTFVNQSAVEIRWLPPAITGDKTQVFYDVDCRKPCDTDDEKECVEESCRSDVTYIPYKGGLNVTQVIVTNLLSFVNYTFKVYAKNRASEVAKRKHGVEGNFTTITFRTTGSIPGKPDVSAVQSETAVVVSWRLEEKNGIIKAYHVTCVRKDDASDTKTLTTKKMEQQFEDLKAGKTYEFQVFAENNFGKGPAGVKTFTLRNGGSTDKMITVIAAGGGSFLLIILIIIIAIIVFRRRRSHRSIEKDYMRSIEQGSELQSMDPDQRRYIDPGNYLDLLELLSTFATELERSQTKLEGLIGQGEFADVYKATLKTREGKDVVAVKVLRPGSSEKNQKDFLSEASIMGQFDHPNVIGLIGVVTKTESNHIADWTGNPAVTCSLFRRLPSNNEYVKYTGNK